MPGVDTRTLGPLRVLGATLLCIPAIVFWSTAAASARYLRPLSVLGTFLCFALWRLDLLADLQGQGVRIGVRCVALALLAPVIIDWWRAVRGLIDRPRLTLLAGDLVVAVALPLIFFFTAPIQRFLPPGWVDSGFYLGYALDFFGLVKTHGWNYHAARVSYILPANLLHLFLAPEKAWLTLIVAFHVTCLVSIHVTCRLLWDRAVAALVVACIAYNPLYLMILTSGYVDISALCYLLVMLAGLSAWSQSLRPGWLVLVGASFMLAALAHPFACASGGLLILAFAWFRYEAVLANWLIFIAAGLLGIAATWLFFVLALNQLRFGPDAFATLGPIIELSRGGLGAKYRTGFAEWLPSATRVFAAPFFILALCLLMANRLSPRDRRNRLALGTGISGILLLPLYDVVMGGSASQSTFYAAFAMPFSILPLAGAAHLSLPAAAVRRAMWAGGLSLGFAAACWLAPLLWSRWDRLDGLVTLVMIVMAAALACLLLLRSRTRAIGFAALFVVCTTAVAMNRDTRRAYTSAARVDNKTVFRTAVIVHRALQIEEQSGQRLAFWFNRSSFKTRSGDGAPVSRPLRFGDQVLHLDVLDTIAALRLWDKSTFLFEIRPIDAAEKAQLIGGLPKTLVVLGQSQSDLESALSSLREAGLAFSVARSLTVEQPAFAMKAWFVRVDGLANPSEQSNTGRPALPEELK